MQRLEDAEAEAARVAVQIDEVAAKATEIRARLGDEAADHRGRDRVAYRGSGERGRTGLDEGLVALYEKLRAQQGGTGAAALKHGACQGCNMSLNPADFAHIEAAPADDIIRCEECGRILVRGARIVTSRPPARAHETPNALPGGALAAVSRRRSRTAAPTDHCAGAAWSDRHDRHSATVGVRRAWSAPECCGPGTGGQGGRRRVCHRPTFVADGGYRQPRRGVSHGAHARDRQPPSPGDLACIRRPTIACGRLTLVTGRASRRKRSRPTTPRSCADGDSARSLPKAAKPSATWRRGSKICLVDFALEHALIARDGRRRPSHLGCGVSRGRDQVRGGRVDGHARGPVGCHLARARVATMLQLRVSITGRDRRTTPHVRGFAHGLG